MSKIVGVFSIIVENIMERIIGDRYSVNLLTVQLKTESIFYLFILFINENTCSVRVFPL